MAAKANTTVSGNKNEAQTINNNVLQYYQCLFVHPAPPVVSS